MASSRKTWSLRPSSRPCGHGSRDRKDAHFPNTRGDQHARARVECRARRHHIVHEDDDRSAETMRQPRHRPCWGGQREGLADIGVTPRGGEACLRRIVPAPPQGAPHGPSQGARQVVRLIEAALPGAPGMQRNGHDGISAMECVRAGVGHQRGQFAGKRATFLVLERVDDLAQRAVVAATASREGEEGWVPAATWAAGIE